MTKNSLEDPQDRSTRGTETLKRWVWIRRGWMGFVLVALALGVYIWVSVSNVLRIVDNEKKIAHTHETLNQIHRVLLMVSNGTASARLFVITGNPKHLEPYHHAIQSMSGELDLLRRLTLDQPQQQKNLEEIGTLTEEIIQFSKKNLEVRNVKGFATTAKVISSEEGKKLVDRVQGILGQMEMEESALLSPQVEGSKRSIQRALRTFFETSVALLALFFTVIYLTARDRLRQERTDQTLLESQERFERFAEVSKEGIFVHEGGKIVDTNNALEKLLGYEPSEMIGMDSFSFARPEDRERVRARIRDKDPDPYELELNRKDGSILPAEIHGRDFRWQGRDLRVVSVWDARERRKARETLKESLDRLRLFDSLAEETILIHDRGIIVDVNQSLARKLGYDPGEMIGRPVSQFSDKASTEQRSRYIESGYPEGSYEITAVRKDGSTLPLLIHGEDFELGGKKLRASIGWDITERKKAERSLRESEERFKKFAEVTKEGIFIHEKGTIMDVNQALLGMLGRQASEVIGTDGSFLLTEGSAKRMAEMAREGFPDHPYELTVRRKDGTEFPAEFHGRSFHYKDRDLRVVSVWDISERKGTERKMLRYERLAAVGELAAGLAHEIRNPLAIISASAQYVEKKTGDGSGLVDYLKDIRKQCQRLDTLVFDILDYSGRGSVGEVREVEVPTLLKEALNLAQSQMGPIHQKVRVEWEMPQGLPRVFLNAQRIQRVFINLILNGYQALGEDGGTLWLSCALDGEGSITARVEDDGPGIPDKDLPRIFEPFFTSKKTGSGLGLPICKRIVEEHNGEIQVVKREPRGASFRVRIPIQGGKP